MPKFKYILFILSLAFSACSYTTDDVEPVDSSSEIRDDFFFSSTSESFEVRYLENDNFSGAYNTSFSTIGLGEIEIPKKLKSGDIHFIFHPPKATNSPNKSLVKYIIQGPFVDTGYVHLFYNLSDSCYARSSPDYINVNSLNEITIPVLNNDWFCSTPTSINVVETPTNGLASVDNLKIIYKPNSFNQTIESDIIRYLVSYEDGSTSSSSIFLNNCSIETRNEKLAISSFNPVEFSPFENFNYCANYEFKLLNTSNERLAIDKDKLIYYPTNDQIDESITYRFSYFDSTTNFEIEDSGNVIITYDDSYIPCNTSAVNDTFKIALSSSSNNTIDTTLNILNNDILCGYELANIKILNSPSNGKTVSIVDNQLKFINPGIVGIDYISYELTLIRNTKSIKEIGLVVVTSY